MWADCNHVQIKACCLIYIQSNRFTLSTCSMTDSLHCVLRICLVSVAVPLQVPNPRRLVCLQHRSPVWSQPRSSSRHTCNALAQFSLTNRLKVSSTPHLTLSAFTYTHWSCIHSSLIHPLVYQNLLQWVIDLNFCWNLQKVVPAWQAGWYVRCETDCK